MVDTLAAQLANIIPMREANIIIKNDSLKYLQYVVPESASSLAQLNALFAY